MTETQTWTNGRPVSIQTGLCWDCDSTGRVTCPELNCDNGVRLDTDGVTGLGRCPTCKGKGLVKCCWPHPIESD